MLAKVVREGGYDTVLFAASVLAADVAAGLAARLDAGLNWDLVDLARDGGNVRRHAPGARRLGRTSTSAGRASRGSGSSAPAAFEPAATGGEPEVVPVAVELEDFSTRATMLEQAHEEQAGPSIEDADVIVAGGRGLGGPENFALVEELAKALGGAVAATRAVVDAGWYPYSTQVGQTGKTVSPKLYVACGISGAIQHKVGMQGSNVIVAINKDPNAPIFEYSDLGVVGDLHQVVPKLTELVRAPEGRLMGAAPATYPPPWQVEEALGRADRRRPDRGRDPDRRRRARPGSPARSGSASCSRTTRRRRSGSARCRSRCSRRASSPARTSSPARSSTRAGCGVSSGPAGGWTSCPSTGRSPTSRSTSSPPKGARRIPTPPTMRNHGNLVASLSQLGRFLADEAEAGGATILPETVGGDSCSSPTGACAACAPATAGAGRTARSWRTSSRAPTSSRG